MTPAGEGSRSRSWRLPAILVLGLIGISWSAVLVRLAGIDAVAIAFWRLLFSVVLVLPFLVASGEWRGLLGLSVADWAWLGLGGICLAFHLVVWFLSLEYTSVASSTVLVTSHPLFVGLLSAAWLGEPPGRREWLGIALAVAGAVVVGWGDFLSGPDPLRGDLLALLGALLTALYFVAGRRLRPRLGLWSYVVPVYAAAAIVCAGLAVSGGVELGGYDASTWGILVAIAVGPMLLGHTSFNWALKHVRAYVVSVVVLGEPIGATLLAVWLLGAAEVPTLQTALGGATILAGIWISLRARARERAGAEGAVEGGRRRRGRR